MAKKLGHVLEQLPAMRRATIGARADKLATQKDLRHALGKTRQDRVAMETSQGGTSLDRIK